MRTWHWQHMKLARYCWNKSEIFSSGLGRVTPEADQTKF